MSEQENNNVDSPASLLIIGQFPPPVHGFSYITQQMAALLSESYDTETVDLIPRRFKGGVLYHLGRLGLALKGTLTIMRHRLHREKSPVYIACEGGIGLIYTIILALAARACGKPVYLHHHSFNYVDQTRALMRILTLILGRSVTHVFLCALMAERFYTRYPDYGKTVIISNSAFVPPIEVPIKKYDTKKPVVVGLISNLNEDKGLSLFLNTLRAAQDKNIDIKGILAGPAALQEDRDKIEKACQGLGDRLEYRGALYAEEKDSFYKELDIFLFPTCYINEAQPTVIAEAMAYGLPVLAYNRGCIVNQVGECGAVFDHNAEFANNALAWIEANKDKLDTYKSAAQTAFLKDRELAIQSAKNLLNTDYNYKEYKL